jgi:hypothetical protein
MLRDVAKKGTEDWIEPGGLRNELRSHEGHQLEDGTVVERRKTLGRKVEVMNECEQDLENL